MSPLLILNYSQLQDSIQMQIAHGYCVLHHGPRVKMPRKVSFLQNTAFCLVSLTAKLITVHHSSFTAADGLACSTFPNSTTSARSENDQCLLWIATTRFFCCSQESCEHLDPQRSFVGGSEKQGRGSTARHSASRLTAVVGLGKEMAVCKDIVF